jgi:hypothetical protein
MGKWKGVLAVHGVLLMLSVGGQSPLAQESDPPTPTEPTEEIEPTEETEADQAPAPRKLGLYVAAGYGLGSAESLNTSILTEVNRVSHGSFEIDDQSLAIGAVGWKLPEGKGDFRLVFNGYKERSYTYDGVGGSSELVPGGSANSVFLAVGCTEDDLAGVTVNDSPGFIVSPEGGRCLYGWWDVSIRDGRMVATRTPATWIQAEHDDNQNQATDPEEIVILDPDRSIDRPFIDDLQNRLQTVDALYGREFGGRRISSRWWAGMRYFRYEGHALGTAWLDSEDSNDGSGFTDGVLLQPLLFAQDASGIGPSVSWEADFNFFNKGLVLYLKGQSAFTFNQIESDSGQFFTITRNPASGLDISAPARLVESRDKSSWQNSAELGARIHLGNGLEFELAYRRSGFLDVVLFPAQLRIPANESQSLSGVSAVYNTQDFRIDGWHGTVGFQF